MEMRDVAPFWERGFRETRNPPLNALSAAGMPLANIWLNSAGAAVMASSADPFSNIKMKDGATYLGRAAPSLTFLETFS
jgi:hypothetical protein